MSNSDVETRVQQIGDAQLLPYLQKLLSAPPTAILHRNTERVHGGTFGIIYRVHGEADTAAGPMPWSLILKVVRLSGTETIERSQPTNLRYWKREPSAYRSGFLPELQGQFTAPRCFNVIDVADNECWLWIEDMGDAKVESWTLERYYQAARHLGQFSGEGLRNPAWLAHSWLGRDLQRTQAQELNAIFHEQLPQAQHDPLVQRFLPDDTIQRVLALWQDRELCFTHLDRLPQTVCHRDACHVNLFMRHTAGGHTETVAIDWEDAAQGPIGEDLVSLVAVNLLDNHLPLPDPMAFDAAIFQHYLQGLQDSGWQGEPSLARLGYTSTFIRYALALMHFIVHFVADEKHRVHHEKRTGEPIEETAAHWAKAYRFILAQTDEARDLMTDRSLN